MDGQLYSNGQYEFLWKLLADPADGTVSYSNSLQQLVDEYPQSGILQALFARFGDNKSFKQASVHFNAKSLYKLINFPSGFTNVPLEKIILEPAIPTSIPEAKPAIETGTFFTKPIGQRENTVHVSDTYQPSETPVQEAKDMDFDPVQFVQEEKNEDVIFNEPVLEQFTLADADEMHDEQESDLFEDETVDIDPVTGEINKEKTESRPPRFDLFSFNESSDSLRESIKSLKNTRQVPALKEENLVEGTQKDISRYHDEAMPYSFIWWLKKTRNEHAGVYQPYAQPRPVSNNVNNAIAKPDELQQQYFENIFHTTSVADLEKNTAEKPVEYDNSKKESQLIDRFIKEEPQIKPQQLDKLDNENKAKKSSEDREEFVTETLAKIYTEQMLFHKAITAYKKLILKFPEKSRYFADKIDLLEKKINL